MQTDEPRVVLKEPFKGLKCPACNAELLMSTRQNIEIDYCPQCRGIWLDRGELDKIIERSTQIAEPQEVPKPNRPQPRNEDRPQDRYEDRYSDSHSSGYSGRSKHGHGQRRKHRRKGGIVDFLGDIFD
jgi:uncharacterized protein